MQIKQSILKAAGIATLFALLVPGSSYAAAGEDLLDANIPQIYGRKDNDVFKGKNEKVIIHIQDAHGNVEAQENVHALIKNLASQGKIDAVSDEGGFDEYSFPGFEGFNQEEKEQLTDFYTKWGLMHGASRHKVLDNGDMPIFGNETKKIYDNGKKAFQDAGANSEESSARAEKIKAVMEAVKLKLYPEDTRGFLQTLQDFENDEITLTSYAKAVRETAEKNAVAWNTYFNFNKVIQSINLEDKIEFAKIDRERLELVDLLETKVSKKIADEIVSKSLNFRLGRLSANDYYSFLIEKATSAKVDMAKFQNVSQYGEFVKLYAQIDDDELFNETDRLEAAIKAKMFKDSSQVEFDKHFMNLDVLQKMINLQMTRKDLAYYQENRIAVGKTLAFLKNQAKALNLQVDLSGNLSEIDNKLSSNEKFYEIALHRDEVMIENTLAMMDEKGWNTVVLVAGGFHSEGITKSLKSKAISHMIITPRITNPDAPNYWKQNMMGEYTEGTKILKDAGYDLFANNRPGSSFGSATTQAETGIGGKEDKPNGETNRAVLANINAALAEGQAGIDALFANTLSAAQESGSLVDLNNIGEATYSAAELVQAQKIGSALSSVKADGKNVEVFAVPDIENGPSWFESEGAQALALRDRATNALHVPSGLIQSLASLEGQAGTFTIGGKSVTDLYLEKLAASEQAEIDGNKGEELLSNLKGNAKELYVLSAFINSVNNNLPQQLVAAKFALLAELFDTEGNFVEEKITESIPNKESIADFNEAEREQVLAFATQLEQLSGKIDQRGDAHVYTATNNAALENLSNNGLFDTINTDNPDLNSESLIAIDTAIFVEAESGEVTGATENRDGIALQNFRGLLSGPSRSFVAPGLELDNEGGIGALKANIVGQNPGLNPDAIIVIDASSSNANLEADYKAAKKAGQHVVLAGKNIASINKEVSSRIAKKGVNYVVQNDNTVKTPNNDRIISDISKISKDTETTKLVTYAYTDGANQAVVASQHILKGDQASLKAFLEEIAENKEDVQAALENLAAEGVLQLETLTPTVSELLTALKNIDSHVLHMA